MKTTRGSPEDWRKLVGCLFAAAMIVAPFLALIYSRSAGLAVAAVALGATACLVLHALPSVDPRRQRAMVIVALVNGALAVVCLVALVTSLT